MNTTYISRWHSFNAAGKIWAEFLETHVSKYSSCSKRQSLACPVLPRYLCVKVPLWHQFCQIFSYFSVFMFDWYFRPIQFTWRRRIMTKNGKKQKKLKIQLKISGSVKEKKKPVGTRYEEYLECSRVGWTQFFTPCTHLSRFAHSVWALMHC